MASPPRAADRQSPSILGTMPIGGPLSGWLAQSWGVRASFLLAVLPCVVASGFVFLCRRQSAELVEV